MSICLQKACGEVFGCLWELSWRKVMAATLPEQDKDVGMLVCHDSAFALFFWLTSGHQLTTDAVMCPMLMA